METSDSGLHYTRCDFVHKCTIGKMHGTDGTHAARVGTSVPFANTLIVLCCGENMVVLAVGEHEDAQLDTGKVLLYHNLGRSFTELTPFQHIGQFSASHLQRVEDENSFSSGQAVGFEHIGGLEGA